jgi:hypothetical protein
VTWPKAESAIERLAVAPADYGLALRDILLLRLRALLARTHGDEAAYAHLRDRYRDMACVGRSASTVASRRVVGSMPILTACRRRYSTTTRCGDGSKRSARESVRFREADPGQLLGDLGQRERAVLVVPTAVLAVFDEGSSLRRVRGGEVEIQNA